MARARIIRCPYSPVLPVSPEDYQRRNALDGMGLLERARLQPSAPFRMEAALLDGGRMNDPVRVDKASLDALTESLRAQSVKLAQAEARIAEQNTEIAALRALLIHHGLETADEATEPEGDRETRET
jgi:hypothetical protein